MTPMISFSNLLNPLTIIPENPTNGSLTLSWDLRGLSKVYGLRWVGD